MAATEQVLGQRTVRGFIWLVGQTLGTKVLNLGGQVALAWLLRPEEFGLFGLALTVGGFTSLLQQVGLREILVQRQRRLRTWANPAFWMSFSLALLTSCLTIIAAPFASRHFHSQRLVGVLILLALSPPLLALSTVTSAIAQIQMRFRAIALIEFIATTIQIITSVILAWMGCGVFSFVAPIALVSAVKSLAFWYTTPPELRRIVHFDPQFKRWRYIWGDGWRQLGFALCSTITLQGDYLLLGLLRTPLEVGIYYFGFNLSMQTVQVVGINLAGVLFPALAILSIDPDRQKNAFLKAMNLLAFVAVPLCFMQAALAPLAMRLIFSPKWAPSIPVVQILSLGMAWLLFGWQAGALLQAARRLNALLRYGIFSVIVFLSFVYIGARTGGPVHVAVAVSAAFAVLAVASLLTALWPVQSHLRALISMTVLPFLFSIIAYAPAEVLNICYPPLSRPAAVGVLLSEGAGCSILYIIFVRLFTPDVWIQIRGRIALWKLT